MKNSRRSKVTLSASSIICFLLGSLAQAGAAEPLKKIRMAALLAGLGLKQSRARWPKSAIGQK